ncbi:hypothetical protein [Bacillus sp. P14.5]|uniref:hypothetical protein n=1 Tax=Bacillus sp. P14.5 TaxID=1983400 RepID=UPI0013B05EE1|nr:hypothetical protein [Bacillus sp. P14.5]
MKQRKESCRNGSFQGRNKITMSMPQNGLHFEVTNLSKISCSKKGTTAEKIPCENRGLSSTSESMGFIMEVTRIGPEQLVLIRSYSDEYLPC